MYKMTIYTVNHDYEQTNRHGKICEPASQHSLQTNSTKDMDIFDRYKMSKGCGQKMNQNRLGLSCALHKKFC